MPGHEGRKLSRFGPRSLDLESRGCRAREISLIINLACRIQISLDSADEKTVGIEHGSAVIVLTAAIDEATARIDRAKRSTN
jgi:hypothetical protein